MSQSVSDAINSFLKKADTCQQTQAGRRPSIRFDTEWPSPCYTDQQAEEGQQTSWWPVPQTDKPHEMFSRLAQALEVELHPDICSYYSSIWSDPLPATLDDDLLTLLFAWSNEDMERLRANLVAHALQQHKRKKELTLFFASTEPDELMISLRNSDGSIWLECPRKGLLRQLSASMADFISRLDARPVLDQD